MLFSHICMCVGIQPQLQLVSQHANLQSTNMTSDQSLMKCEFLLYVCTYVNLGNVQGTYVVG